MHTATTTAAATHTPSVWRRIVAAAGITALLIFGGGRAALAEANGVSAAGSTPDTVATATQDRQATPAVLPEEIHMAGDRSARDVRA